MGLLSGLLGAPSRPMSLDEAMQALEDEEIDLLHEPADFYVKPLSLESEGDVTLVESELKAGNVVLLNIAPLARNPPRLKESLSKLTTVTQAINGDIARISEDKILITKARMKIVKSTRKE